MQRHIPLWLLLVATLAAVGVGAERTNLVDPQLAKDAVAVLRVRTVSTTPLPKYPLTRYQVRVYQVFKNEWHERVDHDFPVHAFKDQEGIPSGECTIYISRYDVTNRRFDKTNGTIWMLVGGNATNGVSHVDFGAKSR
jgi:hypothetical protein